MSQNYNKARSTTSYSSIFYNFLVVGSLMLQLQKENPDFSLISDSPEELHTVFPGQRGCIIPPEASGSALGVTSNGTCPENLHREASQMSKLPQLTLFDVEEQWLSVKRKTEFLRSLKQIELIPAALVTIHVSYP